ncbi:hypothetical protein [Rhizobium sp. Root1220]|uniref:hypothetical protein n=1 Tax=Rhizobium sp. Root1220 TaxID=1736432 RepID=UPI000AAD594D|nr:hypothetical protein [Rhizobium sp. Root1220]
MPSNDPNLRRCTIGSNGPGERAIGKVVASPDLPKVDFIPIAFPTRPNVIEKGIENHDLNLVIGA